MSFLEEPCILQDPYNDDQGQKEDTEHKVDFDIILIIIKKKITDTVSYILSVNFGFFNGLEG